jgi:hypothetical protein
LRRLLVEVTSKSLADFVRKDAFELPRFQRAKKWTTSQEFGLTLSLYRGLPFGAIVVRREVDAKNSEKTKSLRLLDGRQRYEAFKDMRYPSRIYSWAMPSLGLRTDDPPQLVEDKFWQKVAEWLGEELGDQGQVIRDDTDQLVEGDAGDEATSESTEGADATVESDLKRPTFGDEGFSELLELIQACHGEGPDADAFTHAFDFSSHFLGSAATPEYADSDGNGGWLISPDRLTDWIRNYVGDRGMPTKDSFFDWLRGTNLSPKAQASLRRSIKRGWKNIDARVAVVADLRERFDSIEIGWISVTGASSLEEMKIFFLINKGGTPLTYPEILSATSYWNTRVTSPASEIKSTKSDLYGRLEIDEPPTVCKWDVAATLPLRWGDVPLFYRQPREATLPDWYLKLGFEFMSGYWRTDGAVTKAAYGELASLRSPKIAWSTNDLANDMANFHTRIVAESPFFSRLSEWGEPMLGFLPKFVVLDFMLLGCKAFIDAHRPPAFTSGAGRTFHQRMVRLFDRLVLTYLEGEWRNAGDHKVAQELKAYSDGGSTRNGLFHPPDASRWKAILSAVADSETVGRQTLRTDAIDQRVKAVLRYYYVLKYFDPPAANQKTDWDHIMPQSLFDGEAESVASQQHRIYNVALLPYSKNRRKRDRLLEEFLTDTYSMMASDIVKFEEVPKASFKKYSRVDAFPDLKKLRMNKIEQAFDDLRSTWMSKGTPPS